MKDGYSRRAPLGAHRCHVAPLTGCRVKPVQTKPASSSPVSVDETISEEYIREREHLQARMKDIEQSKLVKDMRTWYVGDYRKRNREGKRE